MASKKIEMYAKKQYELDEIKNIIEEAFNKSKFIEVELRDKVLRELGDTKTLLLIYEKYYFCTKDYASLVIMLSEYNGYQSADIFANGGNGDFFSWGTEDNLAKLGEESLKNLGFQEKV